MRLKWKISAELISAGGVKGGEAQLPLALQHGRTDGRTDGSVGARACHAGRAGSGSGSGGEEGNPSPGERRVWDAASSGVAAAAAVTPPRLGTSRPQLSRGSGLPFHLVPVCWPQSLLSVQPMEAV